MVWPFKSRLARAREDYQLSILEARARVLESTTAYWDQYVDPREAFKDQEGGLDWVPLGGADAMRSKAMVTTPQELAALRDRYRVLAAENEFAINGHENRVSYVVGTGLQYELEVPEHDQVPEAS